MQSDRYYPRRDTRTSQEEPDHYKTVALVFLANVKEDDDFAAEEAAYNTFERLFQYFPASDVLTSGISEDINVQDVTILEATTLRKINAVLKAIGLDPVGEPASRHLKYQYRDLEIDVTVRRKWDQRR